MSTSDDGGSLRCRPYQKPNTTLLQNHVKVVFLM